ncbi:hypothetical protein ACJW31_11G099400 [Castanea mollissima]
MATTFIGTTPSSWMRISINPEVASPSIFRQSCLSFHKRFRRRSFSISAATPTAEEDKEQVVVRVRFAPSPTGNFHVGGARTALFNYLFARSKGGKFDALLRDLSWLGLHWDEGPGVGGDYGPYRQSERNSLYKQHAEKLLDSGYVYRCFCSNEELEKMKEIAKLKQLPPVYTGKWATATDEEVQEELAKGTPYTYRFRVPKDGSLKINDLIRGEVGWNLDTLGDFVIMRSNGQPVYNFCVTVDDATMAISHVIREKLIVVSIHYSTTGSGFSMPSFAHVSLILAPDRSKLSKRHGATSVGQFREMGYLPQAMVNYLALLGWGDGTENEFFTLEQLVEKFSIGHVNKGGAIFDSTKLSIALPSEELTKLVGERWKSTGILTKSEGTFILEAVQLLKDGIDLVIYLALNSVVLCCHMSSFFRPDKLFLIFLVEYTFPEAKPVLEDKLSEFSADLIAAYDSGELLGALEEGHAGWQKWVKNFGKSLKCKGKSLFMPLRVLLTGKLHGPDIGARYRAETCGVAAPEAGFVTLNERFKMLRQLDWEALIKDQFPLESAAAISN